MQNTVTASTRTTTKSGGLESKSTHCTINASREFERIVNKYVCVEDLRVLIERGWIPDNNHLAYVLRLPYKLPSIVYRLLIVNIVNKRGDIEPQHTCKYLTASWKSEDVAFEAAMIAHTDFHRATSTQQTELLSMLAALFIRGYDKICPSVIRCMERFGKPRFVCGFLRALLEEDWALLHGRDISILVIATRTLRKAGIDPAMSLRDAGEKLEWDLSNRYLVAGVSTLIPTLSKLDFHPDVINVLPTQRRADLLLAMSDGIRQFSFRKRAHAILLWDLFHRTEARLPT